MFHLARQASALQPQRSHAGEREDRQEAFSRRRDAVHGGRANTTTAASGPTTKSREPPKIAQAPSGSGNVYRPTTGSTPSRPAWARASESRV